MSPIRRFFSPHFFLCFQRRKNHTTGLWAFLKIKQLTYFQAPASDRDSLPPGRKWEPWSLTPGQHKRGSPSTMPAVSNWIIFIQEFLSLWYKQVCVCADLLSNPLVCRIRFFFPATSHTALRSEEIHTLWSSSNVLVKRTAVVFKDPRVSLSEFNFSLLIFSNVTQI